MDCFCPFHLEGLISSSKGLCTCPVSLLPRLPTLQPSSTSWDSTPGHARTFPFQSTLPLLSETSLKDVLACNPCQPSMYSCGLRGALLGDCQVERNRKWKAPVKDSPCTCLPAKPRPAPIVKSTGFWRVPMTDPLRPTKTRVRWLTTEKYFVYSHRHHN